MSTRPLIYPRVNQFKVPAHLTDRYINVNFTQIMQANATHLILMMRVAAAMFGVAEDQRFDHHRHRFGIRQLLADVDKVEIF